VPEGCPYSFSEALTRYLFMHVVGYLVSMVVSLTLIYLPVEKPALDARRAFSRVKKEVYVEMAEKS
jgi:hypothetical protein